MLPDGQDPYTLLGVGRDASPAQIRERYLILMQIWHPDKHQASSAKVREEATRQTQLIAAAYRTLTDSQGRDDRDRRSREQAAERNRAQRGQENRSRQERDQERRSRECRERERAAHEREAREREARERAEHEREARKRADREREARERERPRARWTHPRYDPTALDQPLTIEPVTITSSTGEDGYTLRACFDNRENDAAFLGAEGQLLVFRSPEALHRYLTESAAHDLTDAPGWDAFMNWLLGTGMAGEAERSLEFDLILHSIRLPPAQWLPRLFVDHRDLVLEIAEAFAIHDVLTLLRYGAPLDRLDDLMRVADRPLVGRGARRRIDSLPSLVLSRDWRRVVRLVESRLRWLR